MSFGSLAVVNELDRSVSFLDPGATGGGAGSPGAPADSVGLNAIPRDVTLSANGELAYVTTRDPDELAIIDVAARQVVATIPDLGVQPEAVACTPNGEAILVTNFGSDTVTIISEPMLRRRIAQRRLSGPLRAGELSTAGMLTQVPVGVAPNALAITETSDTAYVTNYRSRSVSIVDIAKAATMGNPISVTDLPNGVALSPGGQFAYVTSFGASANQVSIIRTDTNQFVNDISLVGNFEVRPTGLAFTATPEGHARLLVTARALDSGNLFGIVYVYDFDGVNIQFIRCFDFGPSPPGSFCDHFPEMDGVLPAAVRGTPEGDTAFVSSLVLGDEVGEGLATAAGGILFTVDTVASTLSELQPVGNFPVSLAAAGRPSESPPPTSTPDPNATPTATPTPAVGEMCSRVMCPLPLLCFRDIPCHLNGCPPRDKCCPADDANCSACLGGEQDGAPCDSAEDCPGGSCTQ